MTDILLGLIAIALLFGEVYVVFVLIDLRKAIRTIRKDTEGKIDPILNEANLTLQSIRRITENIEVVTEDVKGLSRTIGEVGQTVSVLNRLVGNLGTGATVRAMSLQTGARAAVQYLITNLMRKGENK